MSEESYIFVSVWREVYNKTGDSFKANDAAAAATKRYSVDARRFK